MNWSQNTCDIAIKSNLIQSLLLFIIYFTKIVMIKFQNKFQA